MKQIYDFKKILKLIPAILFLMSFLFKFLFFINRSSGDVEYRYITYWPDANIYLISVILLTVIYYTLLFLDKVLIAERLFVFITLFFVLFTYNAYSFYSDKSIALIGEFATYLGLSFYMMILGTALSISHIVINFKDIKLSK